MHPEAYAWVAKHATVEPVSVLDIGGRNINGTPRDLFPGATEYLCMDIAPGPGVDVVANAATWDPPQTYDVVVCCETFEHTPEWPQIVYTAFRACKSGGMFIATMAGPGRPAHSAVDGGWRLYEGEHYGNIEPDWLRKVLDDAGFTDITVDQQFYPCDTRCVARRP